jgi:hypothetical protein
LVMGAQGRIEDLEEAAAMHAELQRGFGIAIRDGIAKLSIMTAAPKG